MKETKGTLVLFWTCECKQSNTKHMHSLDAPDRYVKISPEGWKTLEVTATCVECGRVSRIII